MSVANTEGGVPSEDGTVAVRAGGDESPDGVVWNMTLVAEERMKKGRHVPASLCCLCPHHDGGKECEKGHPFGHFVLECDLEIDSEMVPGLLI